MKRFVFPVIVAAGVSAMLMCCTSGRVPAAGNGHDELRAVIDSVMQSAGGEVGIAVITPEGDTVTANNNPVYPLMSVFKLHEALAVAHTLDMQGRSLDSMMHISRKHLSSTTWSPMLKAYPEGDIDISVGKLVRYALIDSDNNASNLLFDSIVSVAETDAYIRSFGISGEFSLKHTEHEMQGNHDLSYENRSTPLACAELIRRVCRDSLVSAGKQDSIIAWMGQCVSASDRMLAAVNAVEGARLYHRTGSGYTNERGEIVAVNDVGYIVLPDGRGVTLAVLVKDYPGPQPDADRMIASITSAVIEEFMKE